VTDERRAPHPEVIERLVRIETMVESMCKKTGDQETRLRDVEKTSWLRTGFAAAAGGMAGFLTKHIT
jgi:hypothetical protein